MHHRSLLTDRSTLRLAGLAAAGFLAVAGPAAGADSYDAAKHQLSIPSLTIGTTAYANLVVSVGGIVSPPYGSGPYGTADTYAIASRQLTVPAVTLGGTPYYNVVVAVTGLTSVGSVTGADSYDGKNLTIPAVQLPNGRIYTNVVATIGQVLSIDGGMPTAAEDQYDPVAKRLLIPAVQYKGHVYTNVTVTAGKVVSAGGSQLAGNTLHSFSGQYNGSLDAGEPNPGLIQASDSNFYGTSLRGGKYNLGAVFRVTPAGVESVVHSFSGVKSVPGTKDGAAPFYGVIQGPDGGLYGTTGLGGTYDQGTVFRISPTGVESVLYSFTGNGGLSGSNDGANPLTGLVFGRDGSLYGTTNNGGNWGAGTVFRVDPTTGTETTLYSFGGAGAVDLSGDAANPNSLIVGADGNFYGTSPNGGAHFNGTVFMVTPAGQEMVLYSFGSLGSGDGATPYAGLVQGADGKFYGVTIFGGANNAGTVFSVATLGGAGIETVLYSFSGDASSNGGGGILGNKDGASPNSLILGRDGNFYGTTDQGGLFAKGTVFRVTADGTLTLLYSSADTGNGLGPDGIVEAADGSFYGTTDNGGAYGQGSLFVLR